MATLDQELILAAAACLKNQVRNTPVESSPGLTAALGAPVELKLEHLQLTGSFKVRGALFYLSELDAAERRAGVVTCSAGNHGKGMAWAGRALSVPVTVIVPSSVDDAKYRGMLQLGAEVIRSEFAGYDDTEAWARVEAERRGQPFVSAFDHPSIMAGNGGTLALEVLADVPEATTFVVPVGGGGLGAGFAYAVKSRLPGARFVAAQLEASPGLSLSLERGEAVTRLPGIDTAARALEGGIGVQTFAVLRDRTDHVALVSESELRGAVRWLYDHHQWLVEPAAAVGVAACLAGKVRASGPVVVVLTGRNMDRGLARTLLLDAGT